MPDVVFDVRVNSPKSWAFLEKRVRVMRLSGIEEMVLTFV